MSTHKVAIELLMKSDYLGALSVAGPLLKNHAGDLAAWYFTIQAVKGLGEIEDAKKNLRSLCIATAKERRPILALAQIKELEEWGGSTDKLLNELAAMYGSGSMYVDEVEMSPPPLPSTAPIEPWDTTSDQGELIEQALNAMAMAWGNAQTLELDGSQLPFVPLLSSLEPEDLVLLFKEFKRQVYAPEDTIVEQDAIGDAIYIIADGEVAIIRKSAQGEEQELAKLGPGAFFGEMAIVSRAPRAAEVRAVEQTVVLRALKKDMEELAVRIPEIGNVLIAFCHARMLENLMRVSPVLAPVPVQRRPEVIALFSTDYHEAGNEIITEGQKGPGLFLIVSGRVRVTKKESGDQIILAELGPGDLFGEISLLMQRPSTATVISSEDTALLFLPSDEFHNVTSEFPELLKGAFDIALAREAQNNSILASSAAAADDLILV